MKPLPVLGILLVLFTLPAYPQKKESERAPNAGRVITEILGVPDNIPQDLIDKAECAIVPPGVLKFPFGFGGSYGRGMMTCRSVGSFSTSISGLIAWRRGGVSRRQLTWLDRSGKNEGVIGAPDDQNLFNPELSRDG
jgi:hypothetical protein